VVNCEVWRRLVNDKNGPPGARGATFGSSWTLLSNPSAPERAFLIASPKGG
jgi:hypothetical protein